MFYRSNESVISSLEKADTLEEFVSLLCAGGFQAKATYSYNHLEKWLDVIKNRHYIFKGFNSKDLYSQVDKNGIKRPIFGFGIHTLCSCKKNGYRIKNDQGVALMNSYKQWLASTKSRRKKCTRNSHGKSKKT